jgi:hemerythrin
MMDMEKIVWNDSFNIQVDELDRQHRRLVELMNRLIDLQLDHKADDAVADILGALTNYFGYHFEMEEGLMLDHGYPEIESHREEHQTFVLQAAYFIATYRESGKSLKRDILTFLKEWLSDHILKTDASFGRFLKENHLA